MSQCLDTVLENVTDKSVLEKFDILSEEVKSIQKANSINTQKLVELDAKLSRIILILEKRDAIRTHLGSSY